MAAAQLGLEAVADIVLTGSKEDVVVGHDRLDRRERVLQLAGYLGGGIAIGRRRVGCVGRDLTLEHAHVSQDRYR